MIKLQYYVRSWVNAVRILDAKTSDAAAACPRGPHGLPENDILFKFSIVAIRFNPQTRAAAAQQRGLSYRYCFGTECLKPLAQRDNGASITAAPRVFASLPLHFTICSAVNVGSVCSARVSTIFLSCAESFLGKEK